MVVRGLLSNTFRYSSLLKHHRRWAFSISCSTQGSHLNSTEIDKESRVLDLLAEVLPISVSCSIPANLSSTQIQTKYVDDFLLPEDKLRGIFLQKFSGRAAVYNALSSVGVELNDELLGKVVREGNLSGESIVLFFNWAFDQPNVSRDVSTYNEALKALGKRKFFEHMMQMLNNMKDKAIIPNSDTLFIVMHSYLRARLVCKAIKFFKEIEKYGLECNKETLSIALKCLSRHSYVGAACRLFEKLGKKVDSDSSMYNILIGGWSKSGRVLDVEKSVNAMVINGVEPDCVTHSYSIEGFGRAGRVSDAVKIFENLAGKENGLSTEVYNAMILSCIANDRTDEGLMYYEEMLRNGFEPNIDTYSRLISHFLKARRVADAIEMFDLMLSKEMVPSAGTLNKFMEPLCSYGPPHAALMFYKKARKVGCVISMTAYKHLLMRLARFGKCGMLLNVWNEMQESGYSSDMEVYECIVNGLCSVGKLDIAVQVMEECIERGFFPGKTICGKLKNKLMDSNKVEMAYKLHVKLKRARVYKNAQRSWRDKGWHF